MVYDLVWIGLLGLLLLHNIRSHGWSVTTAFGTVAVAMFCVLLWIDFQAGRFWF